MVNAWLPSWPFCGAFWVAATVLESLWSKCKVGRLWPFTNGAPCTGWQTLRLGTTFGLPYSYLAPLQSMTNLSRSRLQLNEPWRFYRWQELFLGVTAPIGLTFFFRGVLIIGSFKSSAKSLFNSNLDKSLFEFVPFDVLSWKGLPVWWASSFLDF